MRSVPLVDDSDPCENSVPRSGVDNVSDSSDFRAVLEVFDNPKPSRDFIIEHHCPEFTSVCPKTGQPDFGTLIFSYVPDQLCVELKSLKLYLQKFRSEGIFYEDVTNRILDDLVAACQPRRATLESHWGPRGGITSVIRVQFTAG